MKKCFKYIFLLFFVYLVFSSSIYAKVVSDCETIESEPECKSSLVKINNKKYNCVWVDEGKSYELDENGKLVESNKPALVSNVCINPGGIKINDTSESKSSTKTESSKKENKSNGIYVTCGPIKSLPKKILQLSNTIVNIMQVAVPVILVLFGMIDLVKAVSSQKDDDIRKAQGVLIKRLILGVLVYFIVVIVKLLLSAIGGNTDGIWNCVQCFISNANGCK